MITHSINVFDKSIIIDIILYSVIAYLDIVLGYITSWQQSYYQGALFGTFNPD